MEEGLSVKILNYVKMFEQDNLIQKFEQDTQTSPVQQCLETLEAGWGLLFFSVTGDSTNINAIPL